MCVSVKERERVESGGVGGVGGCVQTLSLGLLTQAVTGD